MKAVAETKWAPGPWGLNEGDYARVCDAEGETVLFISSLPDAHLIAAAPDLYEALEALYTATIKMANGQGGPNDGKVLADARSAMAKARGESDG